MTKETEKLEEGDIEGDFTPSVTESGDETVVETADESETTRCDECQKQVREISTVDVVAGEIVGSWNAESDLFGEGTPAHVGVTGINTNNPVRQNYCRSCAKEKFNISESAGYRDYLSGGPYITGSNLASFFTGVLVVLLVLFLFFL